MSFLQSLASKAKVWTRNYGIIAKNLAKISLKTLVPGAGEILAEGIDYIFEIIEHQDDLKSKDRLDQYLQTIEADQQNYLQILEIIESRIHNLLSEISREFQQLIQKEHQSNHAQANLTTSQELLLKSLFDQAFSKQEQQLIQLQQDLIQYAQNFQIVQQKLDELCKKQIEIAIELKEGNHSLKDGLNALKQLYQQLSLQIQDQQIEHTKNQSFRDFLVEIEHELIHHNLNRARVILENAFIQKTIDLQFKQLYECKINALQGHLTQIEDLLEKSKELANLKGISNLKQQVKHASRWISSYDEYRTFLHQSGKTIGDKGWLLDVPIGIGGMGEVWKAHNLKGEVGAIKFVHSELLTDQYAKKKFFDEIDSLSQLRHPNIVTLKDWGIENATHQLYLVMTYIEGETLRQLINRKAYFTWHEAQTIFRDLVEALYICHQSHIIHKDIKPDNIILMKTPKTQPILIDFGIAKIKKISNYTQTKTAHVVGTDLYMSPEQKSNGLITDKTDIYSLGVTLLECMTGKCSIDEKLEKVVDTTVLDLLEQRLLTFGSRSRYDSAQLFERLGGDLEKLKKNEDRKDELQREISELKREIQHTQKELMQAQGNCQSLENDHKQLIAKNTQLISENTRLISEKNQIEKILKQQIKDDDQKFEKRLKDQSEQIQRLQNELKQLKTQSQIVSYSVGQLKNIALSEVEFNMVYCPVGDFWMGTDDTNLRTDYWKRSKPKHKVKINKGFWIGETQVTQELWEKVMGWNPSHFQGSLKLPVESITWYDCLVFCNRLSELEGFTSCFSLTLIEKDGNHIKKANVEWLRNANGYRLPTEAEWEYAAKAGTDLIYSGSNDLDEIAWYHVNSGEKRLNESLWSEVNESWDKYLEKLKENKNQTHEVKIKKSNAWGLYDMSGNVWEWCMDQWNETIYQNRKNGTENPILWNNEPSTHTVRGGSYGNRADRSRVANRSWDIAEDRNDYRGFRLLRCDP